MSSLCDGSWTLFGSELQVLELIYSLYFGEYVDTTDMFHVHTHTPF